MLDKTFRSIRTIHKWDTFVAGFVPGLISPWLGFVVVYGIVLTYSSIKGTGTFSFNMYLSAMRQSSTFLKVSTLSCFGNAALFFYFITKEYYNAARAVMIATMLYIIAILIYQTATQ